MRFYAASWMTYIAIVVVLFGGLFLWIAILFSYSELIASIPQYVGILAFYIVTVLGALFGYNVHGYSIEVNPKERRITVTSAFFRRFAISSVDYDFSEVEKIELETATEDVGDLRICFSNGRRIRFKAGDEPEKVRTSLERIIFSSS